MTETTNTLVSLTISEVTALLPSDAELRIDSSQLARVTTSSGRRGLIYWDNQDADNIGWAYDLSATDERPAESGSLDSAEDIANVFAA